MSHATASVYDDGAMRLGAEQAIEQIDQLLMEYNILRSQSGCDDLTELPRSELQTFSTRCRAAVERWSTPNDPYVSDAEAARGRSIVWSISVYVGVLNAMRSDIAAGWLTSVEELLHAETFSDFLEMSKELLDKGYKDAAAVIAGSVLESHLRMMATKVEIEVASDEGKARSANVMNADLAKAKVYNKLQQKQITAWQGIRNSAAHGKYDEYKAGDVERLIEGVRDILLRFPA